MDCIWIKVSASLQKGIAIINQLEQTKFEQFLRRIVAKLKVQDTEIFTDEETNKLCKIFKIDEEKLLMVIKMVSYIFKRLLKYILMPSDVKSDLSKIGMDNDKADVFVKVWSNETRLTLNELSSESAEKVGDTLNFSWKVNAELSSGFRKKTKVSKVYLSLCGNRTETEIEFTHPEIYSTFLQLESIQNELDNLLM